MHLLRAVRAVCRSSTSARFISQHANAGLLNGSTDEFYSRELAFPTDLDPLKHGVFWDTVQQDAAEAGVSAEVYVAQLSTKLNAWCKSDEMHDREDLLAQMRTIIELQGSLALVIGGKSSGKSALMKSLELMCNDGA
jgi:hypothetical protein